MRTLRAYFTFKRVFYIGLVFKGLDGTIELLAAIALIFVSPAQIHELVVALTRDELAEDPHDFLSNMLLHGTSHITHGTTVFLIIYLGVHAAVKLISVVGILLKHLWAYPFALVTLSFLTLYQFYEIIRKPSLGIIFLTILDLIVLWLIAREYRQIRKGKDWSMVLPIKKTHI